MFKKQFYKCVKESSKFNPRSSHDLSYKYSSFYVNSCPTKCRSNYPERNAPGLLVPCCSLFSVANPKCGNTASVGVVCFIFCNILVFCGCFFVRTSSKKYQRLSAERRASSEPSSSGPGVLRVYQQIPLSSSCRLFRSPQGERERCYPGNVGRSGRPALRGSPRAWVAVVMAVVASAWDTIYFLNHCVLLC